MLYCIFRLAVLTLIVLTLFIKLRKSNKKLSIKVKGLILLVLLFSYYALMALPVERLFLNFNTPEDAFHYEYFNQNSIHTVLTEKGAIILYGEDVSSVSYTYIDKTNDKWRINSPCISPTVKFKQIQQIGINYFKLPDSEKQFVVVSEGNLMQNNTVIDVKDNLGTEFTNYYGKYKNADVYTVFYYAIVDFTQNDYQLSINGQEIDLQ